MALVKRVKEHTQKPFTTDRHNASNSICRGLKALWMHDLVVSGNNISDPMEDIVSHQYAYKDSGDYVSGGVDEYGRYTEYNNPSSGTTSGFDFGDPEHLKISDEITLVSVVKLVTTPATSSFGRLITKSTGGTGDNWGLLIGPNRNFSFRINGNHFVTSNNFGTSELLVVIARYKSGTRQLYVNGSQELNDTLSVSIPTSGEVSIGHLTTGSNRGLRNGTRLYLTAIYDRFLRDDEIQSLTNNVWQLAEPATIYFPFPAVQGVSGSGVLASLGASLLTYYYVIVILKVF